MSRSQREAQLKAIAGDKWGLNIITELGGPKRDRRAALEHEIEGSYAQGTLEPDPGKIGPSYPDAIPLGMLERGNIDVFGRPDVDGSTVRSMSFGVDGAEILVPTVVGGKIVSDDDAIDEYERTGKHLGKFTNPGHATEYADRLHQDYESGRIPVEGSYARGSLGGGRSWGGGRGTVAQQPSAGGQVQIGGGGLWQPGRLEAQRNFQRQSGNTGTGMTGTFGGHFGANFDRPRSQTGPSTFTHMGTSLGSSLGVSNPFSRAPMQAKAAPPQRQYDALNIDRGPAPDVTSQFEMPGGSVQAPPQQGAYMPDLSWMDNPNIKPMGGARPMSGGGNWIRSVEQQMADARPTPPGVPQMAGFEEGTLGSSDPSKRLGKADDAFDYLGKQLFSGGTEAENRQLSGTMFPGLNEDSRKWTGQHLVGSEFAGNRFGGTLANLGGLGVELIEAGIYGTNSSPEGQFDTALDLKANEFGRQIAAAKTNAERAQIRRQAEDVLNSMQSEYDAGGFDSMASQRETNPIGSRLIEFVSPKRRPGASQEQIDAVVRQNLAGKARQR